MNIIENNCLILKIKNYGAEMCSLFSKKTGADYLWDWNPEIWKWHSPICFPIIGCLKNDQYESRGKKYRMTVHGFARECNFNLIENDSSMMNFELRYDDKTLKKYPYKFILSIIYHLKGSSIDIEYNVKNIDHKVMPFSIGAHTAFRCPFGNNGKEKYSLYFGKSDELECYFTEKGFLNKQSEKLKTCDGELMISKELFARDVMVFENLPSKNVRLQNKTNGQFVRVDFDDFPCLGIWSKPSGAPFVCIEPWQGMPDDGLSHGLDDKRGMIKLIPSSEFSMHYTITIG